MALGRVPELPKPDKATSDSRVAGSPFLFDRTGSSIWSASQDEQPLRFATSGPQAAHPLTPQTRHHNISVSQDFSLQHSIWSYPNNQNSHHLIGALPSAALFTSHPTYPVTSHQRRPSATADVYPFPSARNPGLGSAGGASPHFAHQLDQSSVGIFPTPYPHAQPPPLETTSNSLYDPLGTPQHSPHTRHLPFHDAPAFASPAMPSISSIWANNG
ncbi:hypothetical protein BDP27DRAFT_1309744 [Rhodocollybia butyracea]|uniref:Uncharacterized protein n=1 Tax=Rhodocollybia butyracea TaxID=206335 RepID=A0A9P5QB04_9AGAR|nr:hypothetical protein BDP27DRAFT_1309744 [Rhodocollybia butyracea]